MAFDPQNKKNIRQRMTRLRSEMNVEDRRKANQAIHANVLRHWTDAWKTILIFVGLPEEVATIPLIHEFMNRGRRVCIPSFNRSQRRYDLSELKNFEADLEPGKMGILEPKPSALRLVAGDELDVVFLPGLAFDRHGNRIGYGYGHFDQICRSLRAEKIGLAYHFQIVETVDTHERDVPMNLIITDQEAIPCQKL